MYEHSIYPNPGLRVGDADRERVGERLRHGHAEGRLDEDEFQDRIERCYKARTASELNALVTDLPGQGELRDAFVPRHFGARPWALPVVAGLVTLLILGAVAHGHFPFFLIPLFLVFRLWLWPRRWAMGRRRPMPWL